MGHRQELMSSDELLEVYNLSNTATSVHRGEDAVIMHANAAMLKIWGKDSSVIGKPLLEVLPELKGQPYPEMFRKAWTDGATFRGEGSEAALEIDGKLSTYYFDFEYRPILDRKGRVTAVMNSAIDVTDRVLKNLALQKAERSQESLKRAEQENLALEEARKELHDLNTELEERVERRLQELSESEERFRLMADGTELLIAVGDENNKRIYFNRRWEKVTGRTMDELLKKGWADFIHPDEKIAFIDSYMEKFARRETFTMEFRLPDSNGEYRWYLCQCPPRFRPTAPLPVMLHHALTSP